MRRLEQRRQLCKSGALTLCAGGGVCVCAAGVGVPQPCGSHADCQQVHHGVPCRPAAVPVPAVAVRAGLPGAQPGGKGSNGQVSARPIHTHLMPLPHVDIRSCMHQVWVAALRVDWALSKQPARGKRAATPRADGIVVPSVNCAGCWHTSSGGRSSRLRKRAHAQQRRCRQCGTRQTWARHTSPWPSSR